MLKAPSEVTLRPVQDVESTQIVFTSNVKEVTSLHGRGRPRGARRRRGWPPRGTLASRVETIKEQQLDLFADRTSCHHWWTNQFRLLLASLAYTLLESIRKLALRGTELAKVQCGTIRLKLLKVGAVIIKNTRRIRFLLSSAYPHQQLFKHVAEQLDSS